MKATRYFSIGSDPQNELQLAATTSVPFHLLLGQDQSGTVWISSRTAGAYYELNGQVSSQTTTLEVGDKLAIDAYPIDWMSIFDISPDEIVVKAKQHQEEEEQQKGLRFQLIFIYLAIALLVFLMAFYI